jgi:hypothetical protein
MSKNRSPGTRATELSTWPTACSVAEMRTESRTVRCKLFSVEKIADEIGGRLQILPSECRFASSLMNDCWRPDDPPVMIAEERNRKTSLSEVSTSSYGPFFPLSGVTSDFG